MKLALRSPSLATRLGLTYSLGLALLIALGGLAVYFAFRSAVERELRDDLADRVHQVRLAADDLVLKPQDIARNFFSKDSPDGVVRPLMRLMDSNRAVLFESKGMRSLAGAPFPKPASERSNRYVVEAWRRSDGRGYRLASAWLATSPELGLKYLVQLALDATREERLLRRVRDSLLLGGALGMALAFFLGRALARRGLKPLRDIGRAAALMTPEQLRSRLESQGWSREISELAGAFNVMLANLNDSFERLNRHSAELSHELRTPLHNLLLQCEVALAKERDSADYRKALENNLEEIRRLSSTVDSVLFLARAADAGQGLKKEPFDAGEDLRELADFYEPAAAKVGVAFEVEGSAQVLADRGLLRRALSNLISNALKHSPQGGRIRLSASSEAGRVRLEIRDEGPGVPPGSVARVFEPFYRVPGQASEGIGLGLAIVKRIIELHAGSLIFESLPGSGCRAGFSLPAQP